MKSKRLTGSNQVEPKAHLGSSEFSKSRYVIKHHLHFQAEIIVRGRTKQGGLFRKKNVPIQMHLVWLGLMVIMWLERSGWILNIQGVPPKNVYTIGVITNPKGLNLAGNIN